MIQALVSYLFAAMLSWTGVPDCSTHQDACGSWQSVHHESAIDARDRMRDIAGQIAREVQRRNDPASVIDAVRLAALAFEESAFAQYVDDGSCNDTAWRAAHRSELLRGGCDGGWAYTVWQIHAGADVGRRMVENRPEAVHAAYELLRVRPRAWTTWPRASALADRWIATHGFDAESVDDASDARR